MRRNTALKLTGFYRYIVCLNWNGIIIRLWNNYLGMLVASAEDVYVLYVYNNNNVLCSRIQFGINILNFHFFSLFYSRAIACRVCFVFGCVWTARAFGEKHHFSGEIQWEHKNWNQIELNFFPVVISGAVKSCRNKALNLLPPCSRRGGGMQ